jgi:hypothetical protein
MVIQVASCEKSARQVVSGEPDEQAEENRFETLDSIDSAILTKV